MLSTSVAPVTGDHLRTYQANRTFQASVAGSGAVGATVIIEGSNDNAHFLALGTITLAGTDSATDGFVSQAAWNYVRAHCTAISGSDAVVNVSMGV